MNDDGTINKLGGKYAGMDRYEARKQIVKILMHRAISAVSKILHIMRLVLMTVVRQRLSQ